MRKKEEHEGYAVLYKVYMSYIEAKRKAETYNSGDSLVVTHLTTKPLVHCLYIAKRTGSLAFTYATVTKSINFPIT
jgi:hypothetical protein